MVALTWADLVALTWRRAASRMVRAGARRAGARRAGVVRAGVARRRHKTLTVWSNFGRLVKKHLVNIRRPAATE